MNRNLLKKYAQTRGAARIQAVADRQQATAGAPQEGQTPGASAGGASAGPATGPRPDGTPAAAPGDSPDPAGNLSQEVIDAVLAREEKAGRIFRAPVSETQTAEQLIDRGAKDLTAVAHGEAALDKVAQAVGDVLQGTEKVLDVPQSAEPAPGYRVQRAGLTDAGRCVVRLKQNFPINSYEVKPPPEFEKTLTQVDAIHGTIDELDARRANMNNHVAPMEDTIYTQVKHANDVLTPQAANNVELQVAIQPLKEYLGGRYDKANETKAKNAVRDANTAGEIRQEVVDQVTQETAANVARAVVNEVTHNSTGAGAGTTATGTAAGTGTAAAGGTAARAGHTAAGKTTRGVNATPAGSPANSRRQRTRGGGNRGKGRGAPKTG